MKFAGRLRVVVLAGVIGALLVPALAHAHSGQIFLSNPLTVTPNLDDGAISPGEWSDALHYNLTFGGQVGDLYLKNTGSDLYVGFQIPDPNSNVERFAMQFDSNHNLTLDAGDDQWQVGYGSTFDSFWGGTTWLNDITDGGGYYEVSGRGYWNPTTHVFTGEFKHSLCGPDATRINPIDVCLNLNGPHDYGVEFKYETNGFTGGAPAILNDVSHWADLRMSDNIAPDFSFDSPAPNSTTVGGASVSLSSYVHDNIGVTQVNYYVETSPGSGSFELIGVAAAPGRSCLRPGLARQGERGLRVFTRSRWTPPETHESDEPVRHDKQRSAARYFAAEVSITNPNGGSDLTGSSTYGRSRATTSGWTM